jgi:hypothetical protein
VINSAARSQLTNKQWYRNISAGNPLYSEMELIATVITTGAEGTILFSSIPQVFKHLQLRVVARSTAANQDSQTNGMSINVDLTNGKYNGHFLTGNGSSVSSGVSGFFNLAFQIPFIPGASNTSSSFGAQIIDFLDYSSTTKNKTIRALGGHASGTNPKISLMSNVWLDTAAITSISWNYAGSNLTTGSRLSLYGIKG